MPRRREPDPLSLKIGQRIRKLRKESGLSLEKLAYESELGSKGHLSDVERGLTRPTVSTLKTIADRLGVALLDLVTFPDEDPRQRRIDLELHATRSASREYDSVDGLEDGAGLAVAESEGASVARVLGSRIAAAREVASLTERSLASRAGLTTERLRAIEAGSPDLDVATLARLAAALGVDFWSLVGSRW